MAWLLDTNVLSELRKGSKANPGVIRWSISTGSARHWISTLSLGEIRKGIELLRKKSPSQCPAFERWLDRIRIEFDQTILPVCDAVAEKWGLITASTNLPVTDGLLAATAHVHDLTIVTRNTKDFKAAGVRILSPFV
jgi:predicted nucleic acid-binding protein